MLSIWLILKAGRKENTVKYVQLYKLLPS